MRFPWDKDYFKVCFYAVIGLSLFYIIKIMIDAFGAMLMDIDKITNALLMMLKDIAGIFSPLITALIISYLLDPVVDFFQSKFENISGNLKAGGTITKFRIRKRKSTDKMDFQKSRTAGTALTYFAIIMFVLIFSLTVTGLRPDTLAGKILGISSQLNDMLILIHLKFVDWNLSSNILEIFNNFVERVGKTVLSSEGRIISVVTAAGKFLGNFFIAFVVAFYLLQRKEIIINKADEIAGVLLNGKVYKVFLDICRDLNRVFSGYIRGQMTDALIISILIGSGLKIIGVEFAIVIGILTGFTNLVPFLGAITGFALSVTMALISGTPVKALYAAIFVIAVQQVDSMYIVPKIVGKKVSLAPAAVILAVAIGGKIAGFSGMVLAVPSWSVAKLWFGRYIEKRKNKKELSKFSGLYE